MISSRAVLDWPYRVLPRPSTGHSQRALFRHIIYSNQATSVASTEHRNGKEKKGGPSSKRVGGWPSVGMRNREDLSSQMAMMPEAATNSKGKKRQI